MSDIKLFAQSKADIIYVHAFYTNFILCLITLLLSMFQVIKNYNLKQLITSNTFGTMIRNVCATPEKKNVFLSMGFLFYFLTLKRSGV